MSDQQARQTPIIDLLRDIPADARMVYEVTSTHHQSIPVGVLAKQAADEIERLAAERDELRRQLAEAEQRFDWLAARLEDVQIDNADPNDHYYADEEDVPYPVLWRRAIDAALGLTRPAEE